MLFRKYGVLKMRERTKLLFQQAADDYGQRTRTIALNDDLTKFKYLRVYVGYGNDGMQVNEILVDDLLYPKSSWSWMWTFWFGGGTPGAMGSMRINGWRREANTNTYVCNLSRITYLNNGTAAYSEATNNEWAPVQIWKIVGIYKDGVSE